MMPIQVHPCRYTAPIRSGVFKTLVDVLCKDDNTHNWILQETDRHLLYIRRTSCHPSFRIPGMERGGSFPCLIQNRIKQSAVQKSLDEHVGTWGTHQMHSSSTLYPWSPKCSILITQIQRTMVEKSRPGREPGRNCWTNVNIVHNNC